MTGEFVVPEALRSLGEPLQVHPPRASAGRAGHFTISAILLILAGLTAIGIVNPPAENSPPPAMFISLMSIFAVLAVVCFGIGMYSQNHTLILFPDGLARTGEGAPDVIRWSEVRELYMFIHPVAGKHRIVAQDGRKLEIDASVKDGKALGEAVRRTLFDHMLPAAEKAFQSGETLAFGPLRVDYSFLYYKDKRLAWNEIEEMQLLYNAHTRSVQFEVRASGSMLLPWCVMKSQNIPNLDVFKALAERKRAFTA